MAQPHPELNLRGKRGRKNSLTPNSALALFRAVGMTDEEIEAALEAEQKRQEAKKGE